jgi:hypothetical protein
MLKKKIKNCKKPQKKTKRIPMNNNDNNLPSFMCIQSQFSNCSEAEFLNRAHTELDELTFALISPSDCTDEILLLRKGFGFVIGKDNYEGNLI